MELRESLMCNSCSCHQSSWVLSQHPSGLLSSFLKTLGRPFLAITTTTITKYYFLAVLFFLYSNFPESEFLKHSIQCMTDFTMSTIGSKCRKNVFTNCEKVQPRNVSTVLIIKRPLNLQIKTTETIRISRKMDYWDAGFYFGLPEQSARIDILVSTT